MGPRTPLRPNRARLAFTIAGAVVRSKYADMPMITVN